MTERYKVKVAFLDVGQGDTIIVSIPEKQEAVVIDCVDPNAVITYLKNQGIKHLRGLIITHLHLDHYKGAVEFLNNCKREIGLACEYVLFNWPRVPLSRLDQALRDADGHSDSSTLRKINKNQRKISYYDLQKWVQRHDEQFGALFSQRGDDRLHLNGSIDKAIKLLHPQYAFIDDLALLNNASGVLKIQGVNSSAILMGDLEYKGWKYLLSKVVDIRSDVLKFPHHGAWKDADPNLLINEIAPSVIVISVGAKQPGNYQHPNAHVFEAIARHRDIRLLCTQATKQCAPDVLEKAASIKQRFRKEYADGFVEQSGCPCAGTVIIELGESVSILQPQTKFHHNAIIKTYFKNTHKCTI